MYAKQELRELSQYSDGLGGPRSIPGRVRLLSSAQYPDRLSEPTQPPIQWVPEALSPGAKWQRRKADHSLSFNSDIKNGRAITPLPHMSSGSSS
jgi:hypothetical protein